MNALVKKEIRLLLPGFILSCGLAYTNLLVPNVYEAGVDFPSYLCLLPIVICPLMVMVMALESFGAEVGSGIFTGLLAQPIPRTKLWNTKILLLALAFLAIAFFWCATFKVQSLRHGHSPDWPTLLETVGIFAAVTFSGALWTVLLLRQVAAAFWLTLLVPGGITAIVISFCLDEHSSIVGRTLMIALGFYSLAGFLFARWLFLRAQDVQWFGGNITVPEIRALSGFRIRSDTRRAWSPRVALLAKEFQLHQSQLVIAATLVLLHLVVIVTRHYTHFASTSSMGYILENFWVLWLVMPLLVGCAAVAEERKLGTLDAQLCLPVQYRTQFAMKACVVLLLSLVFGMVMPLLLEPGLLHGLLPGHLLVDPQNFSIRWQIYFYPIQMLMPWTPLLVFVGGVAALGLVSFYASSLSRNTLRALMLGVLGVVLLWFLGFATVQPGLLFPYFDDFVLWRGPLVYVIGVPGLVLALLFLTSRNSCRSIITGRDLLQNLLMLLAAVVLIVLTTTALYHRAWEKLTPFEPAHGPAKLTLASPATMHGDWGGLSVHLPDGRVWSAGYLFNRPKLFPWSLGSARLSLWGNAGTENKHFFDGSNWRTVTRSAGGEQVGIKTDGTLWVSASPGRTRLAGGVLETEKAGNLVRFGTETNWSSMASTGFKILLTKSDGTLWSWGADHWDYRSKPWPGLRAFVPQQEGAGSNWAEVSSKNFELWLQKTDGRVWTSLLHGVESVETFKLAGIDFHPVSFGQNLPFGHELDSRVAMLGNGTTLAVLEDGSLRIIAELQSYPSAGLRPTNRPFGNGSNWLAVAAGGGKVVTLKNDGTLWAWDIQNAQLFEIEPLPQQLGSHSDWIAIVEANEGIVSLAADGSLWFWPLGSGDGMIMGNNQHNNLRLDLLVKISRKPQYLGNVFASAN